MNESQILTALAELNNKLTATHERIFEIKKEKKYYEKCSKSKRSYCKS